MFYFLGGTRYDDRSYPSIFNHFAKAFAHIKWQVAQGLIKPRHEYHTLFSNGVLVVTSLTFNCSLAVALSGQNILIWVSWAGWLSLNCSFPLVVVNVVA